MNNTILTKRYARGLLLLAEEKKITNQLMAELPVVKEIFQDEKVYETFAGQAFSAQKKKELIEKSLPNVSTELKNMLLLLVDRGREAIIPDMCDYFIMQVNEMNSIGRATVTTATPLSSQEIEKVSATFARVAEKKEMQITNNVDPSVVGGIKVQIGNTIYDGTLNSRLARLERHLKN